MNPAFCTTIACLQMAFGASTVHYVGQYTVLETRTHFHYCRKLSPGYSCQSVKVGTSQILLPVLTDHLIRKYLTCAGRSRLLRHRLWLWLRLTGVIPNPNPFIDRIQPHIPVRRFRPDLKLTAWADRDLGAVVFHSDHAAIQSIFDPLYFLWKRLACVTTNSLTDHVGGAIKAQVLKTLLLVAIKVQK